MDLVDGRANLPEHAQEVVTSSTSMDLNASLDPVHVFMTTDVEYQEEKLRLVVGGVHPLSVPYRLKQHKQRDRSTSVAGRLETTKAYARETGPAETGRDAL